MNIEKLLEQWKIEEPITVEEITTTLEKVQHELSSGWHSGIENNVDELRYIRQYLDILKEDMENGYQPGKFEGNMSHKTAELLYEISMNGNNDKEIGGEMGWYGLLLNTGIPGAEYAIISEDNDGFFSYRPFDNEEEARKDWTEIEEEYETFYEDIED